MKILYGVVGEGMGHATRSALVLEHLLSEGHGIKVVVSGKAHEFLKTRFADRSGFAIEEIHGITLKYFGNKVNRSGSLYWNLIHSPKGVLKNIEVYRKIAEQRFRPRLVISDFESWAALYGLNQGIPVVSIDNIQAVNRLKHKKEIRQGKGFDFRVARLAVKVKVPRAYHYLVTSFFYPPVRKKFTTLIPPILRTEVLDAVRETVVMLSSTNVRWGRWTCCLFFVSCRLRSACTVQRKSVGSITFPFALFQEKAFSTT
jgi:uncharacterized protein (TIGR00661 family)